MTKKRRNGGRSKHGRGHVKHVRCVNCYRCTPKDKAIYRYFAKSLVDQAGLRDVSDMSVIPDFKPPKSYHKLYYCVSCAIHSRIVRVRSNVDRRVRVDPATKRSN
eukprot:TRINITY_DN153_c0_g1_i1.p1 TRINITY_DN153_c0_g1~~TRINITY_DN153_c0_g1_i1.p1  ORF type:complete len:105 (+),score=17.33 TRINITY_DN153_c0_g1_i1:141-455(+)